MPEAIIHNILEKVRGTAAQQQAGGSGTPHTRLLAVDLSASPIQPHLYDDIRQQLYMDALRTVLAPAVPDDYDVIALCDPSLGRRA